MPGTVYVRHGALGWGQQQERGSQGWGRGLCSQTGRVCSKETLPLVMTSRQQEIPSSFAWKVEVGREQQGAVWTQKLQWSAGPATYPLLFCICIRWKQNTIILTGLLLKFHSNINSLNVNLNIYEQTFHLGKGLFVLVEGHVYQYCLASI